MAEICDPVYSTIKGKDSSLADEKDPSSKTDTDCEFANTRISIMSDVMLDKKLTQQEHESSESKWDHIPEYAVVDKSKKIKNEMPEYSVVDKSKKVRKSEDSLEDKPKESCEELFTLKNHTIPAKKQHGQPFSECAPYAGSETTFSFVRNKHGSVKAGLEQKVNQTEDKVMPYSRQEVCIVRNKWCIFFFVVMFMYVIMMTFLILAYLSILQLKPAQVFCSNTTSHLDELLSAHLGNFSLGTNPSSANLTNLKETIRQYLNRFRLNESCSLTCTAEKSATMVPITSAHSANMSSTTAQFDTTTPNTPIQCRNNYFDVINDNTWKTVAELNMTIPTNQCPNNLILDNTTGLQTCTRSQTGSCSSVYFQTNTTYSKVFGGIKAYQYGRTNSFLQFKRGNRTIDDPYVDGVSLTYGSPRKHIWTFASDESRTNSHCPCGNPQSSTPDFVGNDYFCDSGVQNNYNFTLAFNNPLWDGHGCCDDYSCCHHNNPPWFCKELSCPTSEPIELRICGDQDKNNEDIAIEIIYLAVHE